MTVADVREAVAAIARETADSEAAHIHEDDLYKAVLRHIAKGTDENAEMAREALKAADLVYDRWYA